MSDSVEGSLGMAGETLATAEMGEEDLLLVQVRRGQDVVAKDSITQNSF